MAGIDRHRLLPDGAGSRRGGPGRGSRGDEGRQAGRRGRGGVFGAPPEHLAGGEAWRPAALKGMEDDRDDLIVIVAGDERFSSLPARFKFLIQDGYGGP